MASYSQSSSSANEETRVVVLTGFMGSGKSTVGPILAARLGWNFMDVDDVIEMETGIPIAQFFQQFGERSFRDRERHTISRLVTGDSLVLALGGGAIESDATRNLLRSTEGLLVVHLDVQLGTTLERCRGTEATRPILADRANLAARYDLRAPLYTIAHISIAVDKVTPDQIAENILKYVKINP